MCIRDRQGIQELERISGLTSEQAKEYLLKSVEEDVKHDTAKLIKELENKAKEEADKKARDLVVTAIQRCAADHVAETTVSVVQLPNDEMKGRIIGREGRNIRTLETLTGVELIIDDTPEAVVSVSYTHLDVYKRQICNYSLTYSLFGMTNHMSPDDHFQDLKRVIAAAAGKAHSINVIMPFLYESRQHRRSGRESLDCALALKELVNMGVENIITFDAHDPRVQNAIPLRGFETVQPIYQFLKYLLKNETDLQIDSSHMMVISPDEGGTGRAVYFANMLGLDMGMFYKRRDYTKIVGGRNPIVAHEFLGASVEGKDVLIVDDMISSGESVMDVAKELKRRKARKVFVCATFGLFTGGLTKFDEYYDKGIIDRILTTNLVYQTPDLLERPYYINVDMSKYIALIIDNLNHDASLSDLLTPTKRINRLLAQYRS